MIESRSLVLTVLTATLPLFALEPAPLRLDSPVKSFLFDVTYANSVGRGAFLAVGEERTSAVLNLGWRRDASSGIWAHAWELPELGTTANPQMRGIATSGTKFLAVGNPSSYQPDPLKAFPLISTSTDGRVWSTKEGNAPGFLADVTYGGGSWVAVGASPTGKGQIQYSKDDGATWTALDLGVDEHLYRSAFDGSQWIAVGEKRSSGLGGAILETRVYSSPDGVQWTLRSSPGAVTLHDVAFNNGVWVAVGGSYPYRGTPQPIILRSTDGINWTDVTYTFPKEGGRLTAVAPTYKGFVAAGNGPLLYSQDGAAWSALTESMVGSPRAIASMTTWNQGALLAIVGDTGAVWIDTISEFSTVGLTSARRASEWQLDGNSLLIPSGVKGSFDVILRAPSGAVVATLRGTGPSRSIALPRIPGLHLVDIRTRDGQLTRLRRLAP